MADQENEDLAARVRQFWLAYMLHRPPTTHSAWTLTGPLLDARPDVRTMQRLAPILVQEPGTAPVLTASTRLSDIAMTAVRIDQVTSDGTLSGRLERGWAAFVSGMKTDNIDEGTLHFERALEGVLHPKNKAQFVSRCSRLVRDLAQADGNSSAILNEIYDARSGFSHAEAIDTVFPDRTRAQAIRRGRELRAILFHVASALYRQIFAKDDLVRFFSSEGTGDEWGRITAGKRSPPVTFELQPTAWQALAEDSPDE